MRSKRFPCFRLVPELKKTEEWDFRFWPREKRNESQKMEEGEGEGDGRKLFLSSPPPPRSFTCAIFRAVSDSRSRSLTLNHKETLTTQAK